MSELKSQEQLKKELSEPLPAKAITKHPTKTYLSSIKAIYVTERMNNVFGIGKWHTKVRVVKEGEKGMIVVKVIFTVPDYGIYYECFGGNDNGGEANKNFDLGDAYKGATTDALTKIGSYLGIAIDVFKGEAATPPSTPRADAPKTTPKTEPSKPEFTLEIAKEIDLCFTRQALDTIWKKYADLRKNPEFAQAVKDKTAWIDKNDLPS